jgi:DNA-directed RNA polymerase subunit RPC12/RpoP
MSGATLPGDRCPISTFEFPCSACGIPIAAGITQIGALVACPTCGSPVTVPSVPQPEPEPVPIPDRREEAGDAGDPGDEPGHGDARPSAFGLSRYFFAWATWSACGTAMLALVVGWRAIVAALVLAPIGGVAMLLIGGVRYTRRRCPGCGGRWVESGWELDPRSLPFRRFKRTPDQCCRCGRKR